MEFALLLVLALAQQQPPRLPDSPVLQDLEFVAATESWVAAQPGTGPPEPYRTLIRWLGDDRWWTREVASRKLIEASKGDARWVMWARMSRDLEVRTRANAILRRLHPCPACGGAGRGPERWAWDDASSDGHYTWMCIACRGTGSIWEWSAWE